MPRPARLPVAQIRLVRPLMEMPRHAQRLRVAVAGEAGVGRSQALIDQRVVRGLAMPNEKEYRHPSRCPLKLKRWNLIE